MAGPRIRTIKPEIFEDEVTAALSEPAFLLYVLFISFADDYGNGRAVPELLASQGWWRRRNKPNIMDLLEELEHAGKTLLRPGLIVLYRVREQQYAHITGWFKHQRIDNAGTPRYPMPDQPFPEWFVLPEALLLRLASPKTPKVKKSAVVPAASRGEPQRLAAGSDPDPDLDPGPDPDPDPALYRFWCRARDQFRTMVPGELFAECLQDVELVDARDGVLVLRAPNEGAKVWLENNVSTLQHEMYKLGKPVTVEFAPCLR